MCFHDDGFAIVEQVIGYEDIGRIAADVEALAVAGAGMRNLLQFDWCHTLALRLRARPLLASLDAGATVPVQCTYFEKSDGRNWLVPLHQDLAIPVDARIEHPELRGWSRKDGMWFVQPPAELTSRLLALRLHLDDCGDADGPLKVVRGSHATGRLSDAAARSLREERGETVCRVARGGVLALRPLILHASSKSHGASRRRVLHFLFGPAELPYGLRWPQTA